MTNKEVLPSSEVGKIYVNENNGSREATLNEDFLEKYSDVVEVDGILMHTINGPKLTKEELKEYLKVINETYPPKKAEKQAIVEKTSEKLSEEKIKTLREKSEKNLKEFGISIDAGIRAVCAYFVSENKLYNEDLINSIKEFQTANGLEANGVIDIKLLYLMSENIFLKQTTNETIHKLYKARAIDENLESEILLELKKDNLSVLDRFLIQSGIDKFKANEKFKKEVNSINVEYTTKYSQQIQEIQNSEQGRSFYATFKDIKDGKISAGEGIKKIATDPTLLLVGGVLFMFGVIGGESKYTNSFMKRIGWLLGAGLLGPAVWNKIGVNEMVKDISDSVTQKDGTLHEIGHAVVNSASKASEATSNFITNTIPNYFKKIDVNKFTTEISRNISKLTNKFSSYNENLKGKDGYIKTSHLTALNGLVNETSFQDVKKEDLVNIKNYDYLKNTIKISDSTIKKLEKAGVTAKDIQNFCSKHIQNSFDNKPDAKIIKDLYWTAKLTDFFTEGFEENGEYTEDKKLNTELESRLNKLYNDPDKYKRIAGIALSNAIKDKKIDDFKIDDFSGIDENTKKEMKNIIDIVKEFNKEKEILKSKIKDISDVKATNINTLTKDQIEGYIGALENIKLLDITSQQLKTEFENAKNEKLKEILGWAKQRNIQNVKIGGVEVNVNDKLNELKEAGTLAKDLETLKKIKLTEVPTSDKKPVEFKKWYDDNEESLDIFSKLLKKYKNSSNEVTKIIIEKFKKIYEFKKNYEEMKAKYIEKIKKIQTKIDKVTNFSNDKYGENRKILDNQTNELEKITGEIVEGFTITDITNFYKKATGEYVPVTSKNTFKFLDDDKKLSTTPKPDLNTIAKNIKDKIIKLENSFNTKIDGTKLNIKDSSTIENFINTYKEKENIISSFQNDSIKNSKETELNKEFEKITNLYLKEIKNSTTLLKLEEIKTNYEDNVVNKLGAIDRLKNFFSNDPVEKLDPKNIKKEKLLNQTLNENADLIKKAGVLDFFNDSYVKRIKLLKEDAKVLNPNKNTLKEIINYFKGFKNSNYSETIKGKAKKVFDNLNNLLEEESEK